MNSKLLSVLKTLYPGNTVFLSVHSDSDEQVYVKFIYRTAQVFNSILISKYNSIFELNICFNST